MWGAFVSIVGAGLYFVKKLKPYLGQLMVLAGIFWVFVIFYLISYSFRAPAPILGNVVPGWTIPRMWFYAFMPVMVLVLIPILRGKEDKDTPWGNVRLVGIILGALIISVALFPYIGYYISSALFVVVCMYMLGTRSKIELIAMPVGWIIFSYFVFARLLSVRLPVGSLITGIMDGIRGNI
jgi:hypothetical protein